MIRVLALVSCSMVVSACSKKDTPPKEAPAAPAPAAPTAPTAPPTPPEPEPAPPKQADIQHGSVYWGVYFAVAPVDSPAFVDAQRRAKAMGFEIFHKDPGCDVPAGDGPPKAGAGENMLIAAYFDAEADARKVAEAYGDPAPWVGQVKTMCLD